MSQTPAPWRVAHSEQVVQDRWMDLRADSCVDSRGRSIHPYYVLNPADWITILALDEHGQAITVEEYHHGAGIVGRGLVGGAVDEHEDPQDAAARELLEETGCLAGEIIDLGWTWANWGNHTNRSHHYLGLRCQQVSGQSLDPGETIVVHREPVAELGGRLEQSYHQLTWYKAMAWLTASGSAPA